MTRTEKTALLEDSSSGLMRREEEEEDGGKTACDEELINLYCTCHCHDFNYMTYMGF